MLGELSLDVVKFLFGDVSSADGASLVLWHLVLDFTPELVFLPDPLHKPIPVQADQVESVEALVYSHEVSTVSELLLLGLTIIFAESLEAHRTSTLHSVVILSQDFSNFLMKIINETSIICILLFLVRQQLKSKVKSLVCDFIMLRIMNQILHRGKFVEKICCYLLFCKLASNFIYLFVIKSFHHSEFIRRWIIRVLFQNM